MQVEVGSVLEGKVTGITKFGAFLDLGEGKTGMVHISEVAPTYVKEISDHLKDGDVVKVKVLSISPEGKISLSIKKAMDPSEQRPERAPREGGRPFPPRREGRPSGGHHPPLKQLDAGPLTFEDMMSKFKTVSDDRASDIRRNTDNKRGSRGGSRRKG